VRFYFKKKWWNGEPYDPKLKEVGDFPKPTYRPGWHVLFADPEFVELGKIVGKVLYVKEHEGVFTYNMLIGWSLLTATEETIFGRVTLPETP